jgi:membrane protein YqaA with SNARE-associated domain
MILDVFFALFLKLGLFGLLFSSFISSLVVFPAYASFLIPIYVRLHFNLLQIFLVLTVGAVAGEVVNYYLGYIGAKYVFHSEIKKAEKWLNRWGEMSIFIVNLIPVFPADFVNLFVGFFRMDFKTYLIGMTLGKAIQYALLIYGIEILFKYASFV